MRTGKLKDLLCQEDWQLLYTVPNGEHGIISIHLISSDGSAVEFQVAHVKQGNGETITREVKHSIISPFIITDEVYTIKGLGVGSRDDIYVTADVSDVLVASVNTQGIEYSHGVTQRDNRV